MANVTPPLKSRPRQVEVLLPNHLPHGFDYAVPESMALAPGDYVRVPFGSRELPGVVWKESDPAQKVMRLKTVEAHYTHLPPMHEAMRRFIDWMAWYTVSPRGSVLKMTLPITEALNPPGSRERTSLSRDVTVPVPVALSPEQQAAADGIREKLERGFSVTLIDGVTGSGKTEVYFDAIARVLGDVAKGDRTTLKLSNSPHPHIPTSQILVLLPEISLSVQWLERFRARFGFEPHVWHSDVPPGRRKQTWRAVVRGEARVVVGARSALLLPYRDLRLIVADEEHDSSYKQEEGVIYQARDMAVARARIEAIPILLVSATPSLETYHNVRQGRYASVHLDSRHAGASFPDITLVDMRSSPLERGAFLAGPLREAMAQTLSQGHQSMLFLNRRGYAPLMLCRNCAHRFQCPQCTAWLVLHRARPRLQCHHCGYVIGLPDRCPACQAEDTLFPCGPGVERIAEEVATFLPQARLAILASDSTENYGELQARIHAMQSGAIDVLIGTQMIAKGHHFENLVLVGVVDADLGLGGGDLRATERTYQLLHQLSGRAGRARVAGTVLVQSFMPQHPVMQALVSGDREAFMQLELEERKRGRMPPFVRLVAVIVESVRDDEAAAMARELARAAPRAQDVEVLGPAPAPLFMLRGKYRYRLLVRAARNFNMQAYLAGWLEGRKLPRSLRVKVDVDPYSFL